MTVPIMLSVPYGWREVRKDERRFCIIRPEPPKEKWTEKRLTRYTTMWTREDE